MLQPDVDGHGVPLRDVPPPFCAAARQPRIRRSAGHSGSVTDAFSAVCVAASVREQRPAAGTTAVRWWPLLPKEQPRRRRRNAARCGRSRALDRSGRSLAPCGSGSSISKRSADLRNAARSSSPATIRTPGLVREQDGGLIALGWLRRGAACGTGRRWFGRGRRARPSGVDEVGATVAGDAFCARWVVPRLGCRARRATRPGRGRAIGLSCGHPGLVPQPYGMRADRS